MKVIVIIPAYNETESIEGVVAELRAAQPDYDYVVINDCSTDDTEAILKKNGYNQKAMASALRVIEGLQGASPGKVSALFSTHPNSGKRAKKLEALDK